MLVILNIGIKYDEFIRAYVFALLPEKPRKYGLLLRYLADAQDRYIFRVIPYTSPAINAPPSNSNIQVLVLKMCSDLFHTGKIVTGDRLYSAIDTAEMLYEKKLTYCGKIKTVKGRKNESSALYI